MNNSLEIHKDKWQILIYQIYNYNNIWIVLINIERKFAYLINKKEN